MFPSPPLAEHAWLLLSLLLLALVRPPSPEAATVGSAKHRSSRRAATPRCACPGCEGNPLTQAAKLSDADALETFRDRKRAAGREPDTITTYTTTIGCWLRWLRINWVRGDGPRWDRARADTLRRWLGLPEDKRNPPVEGERRPTRPPYLSPSTQVTYSAQVVSFYKELAVAEILVPDPMSGWVALRQPRPKRRTIAREALREVITAAAGVDRRLWAMIWTGYRGALRAVEIARAEIGDVDLHGGVMEVRGKGGGGEVTRTIPLHEELWAVLTDHMDDLPSSGPLFPAKSGRTRGGHLRRRTVVDLYRKALAPYGETGHVLRHLMAQETQVAGRDADATAGLTGHADLKTLRIYTGAATEHTRRAVDAVPGLHQDFHVVARQAPRLPGGVIGTRDAPLGLRSRDGGPRLHRHGGGQADRTGD